MPFQKWRKRPSNDKFYIIISIKTELWSNPGIFLLHLATISIYIKSSPLHVMNHIFVFLHSQHSYTSLTLPAIWHILVWETFLEYDSQVMQDQINAIEWEMSLNDYSSLRNLRNILARHFFFSQTSLRKKKEKQEENLEFKAFLFFLLLVFQKDNYLQFSLHISCS